MIITRVKGGLGNQMFHYAAGRSLAHRLDTKLTMDLSWFSMIENIDTPRHYELGCFNIKENFIKPGRFALVESRDNLKVQLYNYTKGLYKPRFSHFIEGGHTFNEDFLELKGNVCIEGWWQTEKYFKDIRPILLKEFSYKKTLSAKNQQILEQINTTSSVSLHVRRGDYAQNKHAKAFHGLMGLDYYEAAVKRVAKKVKEPHFFVFSDDPAWCKKNLKLGYPATYVSGNHDGSEDMRLMRECKHNILANSTFSWWGAWLNDNPDKIVIAPKKWFANSTVGTTDVIPKDWVQI